MNESEMNEYVELMEAVMQEDAIKEQLNDALLQQDLRDAYEADLAAERAEVARYGF